MLGHDPYQRKTIPKAFWRSVLWGEFNEMNASARREDLFAFLDCAVPTAIGLTHEVRALRSRRRSAILGWMLLTGAACSSPLDTRAADWLSNGTSIPAAGVVTPTPSTPPTPPLPPSPPLATPASPANSAAKSPVQEKEKDKPEENSQSKASGNVLGKAKAPAKSAITLTWQSLTSWWTPPAPTSKTPLEAKPPQAKAAAGTAASTTTTIGNSASPARTLPGGASPSTSTVGRFDPEFGPAGHFVTDADEPAAQRVTRPASPRLTPVPQPSPDVEHSAVATDEPVSLVSWLSSFSSGGHGHGGTADACPDVCLTDTCCPTWEAQVDALFLWQGNIQSRPLYVETASGATALDANQLYAPAAIAPRYALTYHRDDCRAIEVNYFQVWGFNGQQAIGPAVDGNGEGIFTASNLVGPDYDRVAAARATSSANIQSLEVNLRRTDGGMIEWISGFRWLQWGQNLSIEDVTVEGNAVSGGDIASVNTLNNLYGWQWGGDMMLWNAGRWLRVNGIAKAGVYYNHQASQNTFYTDFSNPDVNAAASNDTVSFVGETGVNASLALTNWLSWRAGYTFFWLGGMAVPARQLGLTNVDLGTTSVNTNGSVMLHGVNTGLEARW